MNSKMSSDFRQQFREMYKSCFKIDFSGNENWKVDEKTIAYEFRSNLELIIYSTLNLKYVLINVNEPS